MSAVESNPQGSKQSQKSLGTRDTVILVSWGVAVLWVLATYFPGAIALEKGDLDGRGSVISALFSGAALIGVVLAIFLQREELSLQRQELKETREELKRAAEAQEQSAAQHRLASTRQSREQFLTARLNVELSKVQIINTGLQVDLRYSEEARVQAQAQAAKALSGINTRISILEAEIIQGFDGGPWNIPVQKEAVRLTVLQALGNFVSQWDAQNKNEAPSLIRNLLFELDSVARQFRYSHPEISANIDGISNMFKVNTDDVTPALNWSRSAEGLLRKGTFPWV
jgi:hypothetical protein